MLALHIDVELGGAGAGWTEISADVLLGAGVQLAYGMQGGKITDRVASTGTLYFTLDNSEANSSGRPGYYSPGHALCRAGWRKGIGVRVRIEYGSGSSYEKWRGVVESICPTPGGFGLREVPVTCVDWMDEAGKTKLRLVPVQADKRSDQIFKTIVANIPKAPAATQIGNGMERYAYALDQSQDDGFSVLTEFQRLANSELGYVYLKGGPLGAGILCFEDRRRRGTVTNSAYALTVLHAMQVADDRGATINRVQVKVHPRTLDRSPTVIFSLDQRPYIPRLTSQTFKCPYKDKGSTENRIGAVDQVEPVATTDYVFNGAEDGSGLDLTGQLSISCTWGGNSAQITVTNLGPEDGYLTSFQLRGRGIYDQGEVLLEAQDAGSIASEGESLATLDMAYQSDLKLASDAACYLLAQSKGESVLESVTFVAMTEALVEQAVLREISDRIDVAETMTAVDGAYFINGVRLSYVDGVLTCSWTLASAGPEEEYLILDSPTRGRLDVNKLAYGSMWNRYWILDVSQLDVDTSLSP
jgi:hypothetical protein